MIQFKYCICFIFIVLLYIKVSIYNTQQPMNQSSAKILRLAFEKSCFQIHRSMSQRSGYNTQYWQKKSNLIYKTPWQAQSKKSKSIYNDNKNKNSQKSKKILSNSPKSLRNAKIKSNLDSQSDERESTYAKYDYNHKTKQKVTLLQASFQLIKSSLFNNNLFGKSPLLAKRILSKPLWTENFKVFHQIYKIKLFPPLSDETTAQNSNNISTNPSHLNGIQLNQQQYSSSFSDILEQQKNDMQSNQNKNPQKTTQKITNIKKNVTKNNQNSLQRIISTCLCKLQGLKNKYAKYKYEINQQYLIINNQHQIAFNSIKKIKLIHNQNNYPQIKILYNYSYNYVHNYEHNYKYNYNNNYKCNQVKDKHRTKSSIFERNQSFGFIEEMLGGKGKKSKQKEVQVFLCESYENLFTIYSSIIVRKLIQISKQPKINRIEQKLGSLAVTSYKLNSNKMSQSQSNDSINWEYELQGSIMKRSKHLKNWQKRYIKISPKSSKNQFDNIRQLWTRFQLLQSQQLVMKMYRKNRLQKIQIAIPISNYADVTLNNNWLFGLVSLLKGSY